MTAVGANDPEVADTAIGYVPAGVPVLPPPPPELLLPPQADIHRVDKPRITIRLST